MEPSPTDLAYLAGIVDGEGSISMLRLNPKRGSWRIVLQVGVCDRILVEWIEAQFGGHTLYEIQAKKENHRDYHHWRAYGHTARYVLPLIEPYLLIKRQRALWAIEVLAIQAARRGGRYAPVAAERLNEIRELFDASHR